MPINPKDKLIGVNALRVEPITMQIIMVHWRLFASSWDVSDLEADGVMIEAIIPMILFALIRICRNKAINFDFVMRDAQNMDRCATAVENKRKN